MTNLQRSIDVILRDRGLLPLADFIREGRQAGRSHRALARLIATHTGVMVSDETVRRWDRELHANEV